ncbi:MAG: transposase [Nanoarchaeota archaeon]|nr:transposase [Nanoarchaeota archaeon]
MRDKTKLSSAYVQQCKDKAIWIYKSHKKLHLQWKNKLSKAKGKYYHKILKRKPSFPKIKKRTPVRLDYRTLKIKTSDLTLSHLWFDITSLRKHNRIMIPLNPSDYHLSLLQQGRIIDCQLIKKDKYYLHVTCEYSTPLQPIRNIRSIDLGINRSVTTVLYTPVGNQINILKEGERKHRLEQFDNLIAKLQNLEKWKKLKQIRKKRANFIENQERKLAKYIATISKNSIVGVGYPKNLKYRSYRGNGNKRLRKKLQKLAYSRFISYIVQNCEKQGIEAVPVNEYNTSKQCSKCESKDTIRPYNKNYSLFKCKDCGIETNADVNGARNIARRLMENKSFYQSASDEHALTANDCSQKSRSAETKLFKS